MARAVGAAFGIDRGFGRHAQRNLRQRIAVGVGIRNGIAALLFEGPMRDIFLIEVSYLQMSGPLGEGEMTFDDGGQAMVQFGFVARQARNKLRHQIRVIESLLFLRAQIRFRAAQLKHVAMHDQLTLTQRLTVVTDDPLEGEREETVHPRVDKVSRLSGLFVEKMGERAVSPNILALDHRISQHDRMAGFDLLQAPLVKPVVFAQRIGDAVVRSGLKSLQALPE